MLVVGGLAPSTAAAAFEAHGGIRNAYVLDAKQGQRLELVNAHGRVVGSGRADRLGSKMFRQVLARCVACVGESRSLSINRDRLSAVVSDRNARASATRGMTPARSR